MVMWSLIICSSITSVLSVPSLQICPPLLCQNGGTCLGTSLRYRCQCLPGYTGSRCEEVENKKSRGVCVEAYGGYSTPQPTSLSLSCTGQRRIHIVDTVQGKKGYGSVCRRESGDTCVKEWDTSFVQAVCEGRSTCRVPVDGIRTGCSTLGTHYVHIDYVCIEESSMFDICNNGLSNLQTSGPMYLTSPGYPSPYRNRTACQCELSVSHSGQARAVIMHVDMSPHSTCTNEYLEYITWPQRSSTGSRVCNASEHVNQTTLQKTIYLSSSSSLKVTFVTGSNYHRRGFLSRIDAVGANGAKFKLSCGPIAYPTITRPTPALTTTTPSHGTVCPDNSLPLTGIFCGRGPNRKDCPSGHYCEIAGNDAYAVCCRTSAVPSTTTITTTYPEICPDSNYALPGISCGQDVKLPGCPNGYSCFIRPENILGSCCKNMCPNNRLPLYGYNCGRGQGPCPDGTTCLIEAGDSYAVCCENGNSTITPPPVVPDNKAQKGDGDNAALIGGVASAVVLLIVIIAVIVFIFKRYKSTESKIPLEQGTGRFRDEASAYNSNQYKGQDTMRPPEYENPAPVQGRDGGYEDLHFYEAIPYDNTHPAMRPLPQAPNNLNNPNYQADAATIPIQFPSKQAEYDYANTKHPGHKYRVSDNEYADRDQTSAPYESYTHLQPDGPPNPELYTHLTQNNTNVYLELLKSGEGNPQKVYTDLTNVVT